MEFAERAELARLRGEPASATELFRRAFDLEREAADIIAPETDREPTRSVLHRSAASLALDCGEFREAERLIARALVAEPPATIANELRDLLEQVYFRRHLDLRGIVLEPAEVQLSIAGGKVGYGEADSEEFVSRVHQLERLLLRTAERVRGLPYRESGAPKKAVRDDLAVILSAPRGGSFAVTMRLGRPKDQTEFFAAAADAPNVVDELMMCLDAFQQGDAESLREHISEAPYFRNFVGIARQFAPDGQNVSTVGLTTVRTGHERRIALTRPRDEIPQMDPPAEGTKPRTPITVTGTLRFADSMHPEVEEIIKLVDDKKKAHRIRVPQGMMTDIVKPLWYDRVTVRGYRVRKGIVLEGIEAARDTPPT